MFGTKDQSRSRSSALKKSKDKSRFRRMSRERTQKPEERSEIVGIERRGGSTNREMAPAEKRGSGLFFSGGEKSQKKIVYREFSEITNVLELVNEEIPELASETDVVVKISVSNFSHGNIDKI